MSHQTLVNWRNKLKRLVIEFHHHKNKTSSHNVIHEKDRSKPLMTLRTQTPNEDLEINDSCFIGFSDIEENAEEDATATSIPRGVLETVKYVVDSIKRADSDASLRRRRRSCDCQCHLQDLNEIDDHFYHTEACASVCTHLSALYKMRSRKLAAALMEQGVNYVEMEAPRRRSAFYRLKSWWRGESDHPPRHTVFTNLIVNLPLSPRGSSSTAGLEILAESHCYIPLAKPARGPNAIPQHLRDYDKHSSFSRRNSLKPTPSLISLTRDHSTDGDCNCAFCERKAQRVGAEPWKVVMNDYSLYAALLSTGMKPKMPFSSHSIRLDFTPTRMGETRTNPLFNDENMVIETDLLDMTDVTRSKSMSTVQTTLKIETLLRSQSQRPRSKALEEFQLSPVYQDMLLDYTYSDESGNELSLGIQPLNFSKRSIN